MCKTEAESMVKKMREIREHLNEKIADMDFQEQQAYIKESLKELKIERKSSMSKS